MNNSSPPESTRNQQHPSTAHQQYRPKKFFSGAETFQGAVVKEEGQPPPSPPPDPPPMRPSPPPPPPSHCRCRGPEFHCTAPAQGPGLYRRRRRGIWGDPQARVQHSPAPAGPGARAGAEGPALPKARGAPSLGRLGQWTPEAVARGALATAVAVHGPCGPLPQSPRSPPGGGAFGCSGHRRGTPEAPSDAAPAAQGTGLRHVPPPPPERAPCNTSAPPGGGGGGVSPHGVNPPPLPPAAEAVR